MRGLLRALLPLLVTLVVTLALAEVGVRLARPAPRAQIIRPDMVAFEPVGDVMLWRADDGPLAAGLPCPADAEVRVALAGDSVLWATDGPLDRRVRDFLEERLGEQLGRRVCVVDASQPGYVPQQQLAAAQWVAEQEPLDLLVMLVWKVDRRFTLLDGVLYDFDVFERDAGGLPVGPVDLPDGLHRALFRGSALWRYATLALSPPDPTGVRPPHQAHREALAWAEGRGLPVVLMEATPFDRPVAVHAQERADLLASGGEPTERQWNVVLQREAAERGVPYLFLPEVLRDEDLAVIAIDTCCHLRQPGHRLVADALAPVVAETLRARTAGEQAGR